MKNKIFSQETKLLNTLFQTIKVDLKPTFISGIMKESGNKPPGVVPNKSVYMIQGRGRHLALKS